ncbi:MULTISPECIES: hypothetical protein [Sphingobacterium]|uniref:Uncharacterized protein n=1 Tax=Sphingobacterium tenebrionis TaxID=3111775 RepID=A0ABU8I5C0_9SPHI|nr:hypothetical protein [Sphingobacterium sp. 1.A.4]
MKTIAKLGLTGLFVVAYAAFNSVAAQKYKFKASLKYKPAHDLNENTKSEKEFLIDFNKKKFGKFPIVSDIKIENNKGHQDPKLNNLLYIFAIEGYKVWLTISSSGYYDELFLYDKDYDGIFSIRYYGKATEINKKKVK